MELPENMLATNDSDSLGYFWAPGLSDIVDFPKGVGCCSVKKVADIYRFQSANTMSLTTNRRLIDTKRDKCLIHIQTLCSGAFQKFSTGKPEKHEQRQPAGQPLVCNDSQHL